jgi:hypothetical protein
MPVVPLQAEVGTAGPGKAHLQRPEVQVLDHRGRAHLERRRRLDQVSGRGRELPAEVE